MQNTSLEELVLSGPGNYVGVSGACCLASALLDNHTLKKLWLDKNNIAFGGLTAFLESFEHNKTLEHLDFSQNMLDDRAGEAMENCLANLVLNDRAGEAMEEPGLHNGLGRLKQINVYANKFSQKYLPSWRCFRSSEPFDKIIIEQDPDIEHNKLSLCGKDAARALGHIQKKEVVRDADCIHKVIAMCTSGRADRVAQIDMSQKTFDQKSGSHR
jgi:hypothetical protein